MAEPRATLTIQLRDLASKGLSKMGGAFQKLARDMDKAKFVFAGLATAVGLIGKAALHTAGDFEQWRIAFTTMLGSAAKAEILLNKIRKFALKTPFDLPQVVQGSKRLMAFGIAAADIIPSMKALGDIASGVSVPIGRLVTVFGQVRVASKLNFQEALQFTNAGVPIYELLAKHLNTNITGIKKLGEQGKISFHDVQQALFASTEAGGLFHDMMKEQNLTLLGSLSELSDEFVEMRKSIGEGLLPVSKEWVRSAIKLSQETRLWVNENIALVLVVLGVTGAIAGFITVVTALIFALPIIIAAFKVLAFTLAVLVSPLTAVIAVIAIMRNNFAGLKDTARDTFNAIKRDLRTVVDAFLAASRGDFQDAFKTLMDVGAKTALSLTIGFKRSVNGIKKEWNDLNEFFKAKTLGATGGLGESGFNAPDGGVDPKLATKLRNLEEHITKRLELALFEKEEIARMRDEDLEHELRAMGREDLADRNLTARRIENAKKTRTAKIDAVRQTLNNIASIQKTKSKEMNAVIKSANIAAATMHTFDAATRALKDVPFPFNIALSASIVAAGLANVSRIASTPLAAGGVVLPTSGGTQALIGEAGSAEAVIPLDDEESTERIGEAIGGGGPTFIIGTLVAGDDGLDELARRIDEKFFHLDRTNERNSD